MWQFRANGVIAQHLGVGWKNLGYKIKHFFKLEYPFTLTKNVTIGAILCEYIQVGGHFIEIFLVGIFMFNNMLKTIM